MGKGNRNKLQRAQSVSEIDQYLAASASKKEKREQQKKKESMKGKIIAAICILLVVVIVVSIACSVLQSTGTFMRATNVLKMQDGHYKIDKAMMNFFFNEQIMSWYSNYGSYASYFGLDFSKDMRNQIYSQATSTEAAVTWYDYFLDQTKSQVQLYLAYANEAYDMGLRLDDEDWAEIDEVMVSLDEYVAGYGLDYSYFYGEGVSKKDIKDCYEIIYLANKYSEVMTEKYEEDLKKDDSAVIQFPEDNKESFYTSDVLKYEIKVDQKEYKTDAEYNNAIAAAKARAQKIAAATTPEEFFELIKADLAAIEAEKNTESDGPADVTEKASSTATEKATEAATEKTMDDYKQTIEYTTGGGKLENWLFGIETATEATTEDIKPAQKGETYTEEKTETYTEKVTEKASEKASEAATSSTKTYKKYTVTAYCVYEEMHLDTDLTRNLGYIVSTDKATVEKILADFKAGELTADALDKLGAAAAEKLGDNSEISIGHSAPKKVAPGYFRDTDATFEKIDEWLEAEGRKEGDVSGVFELVQKATSSSEKDTKYYAICFFESYDKEVWYVNATSGAINEMFEVWYQGEDGNGGKLASNPVKYNESAVSNLYQTYVPYLLSSLSSSTTTK